MNITITGEDEDRSIHDLILIPILAVLMELRKTII
jgi:PHP family Zn ribbon phosphoesterase